AEPVGELAGGAGCREQLGEGELPVEGHQMDIACQVEDLGALANRGSVQFSVAPLSEGGGVEGGAFVGDSHRILGADMEQMPFLPSNRIPPDGLGVDGSKISGPTGRSGWTGQGRALSEWSTQRMQTPRKSPSVADWRTMLLVANNQILGRIAASPAPARELRRGPATAGAQTISAN